MSTEDLYGEAKRLVLGSRKPSTSYVQRTLKLGFSEAAGYIERLEASGLITKADYRGRREMTERGIDAGNAQFMEAFTKRHGTLGPGKVVVLQTPLTEDARGEAIFKLDTTVRPNADEIESADWPQRETQSFIDQLRLQAREQLDPAFSRFMGAVADRLASRHQAALLWDQVYQDRCEGAFVEQTVFDQERKALKAEIEALKATAHG